MLVVAALAGAGTLLQRWVEPVWKDWRARQPALRLESTGGAAGQGVTLALLGGFRALVADGLWLRMHVLWERYDLAGTDTLVRLVSAVDPRPAYFWLNGARILGYDLSAWRILGAGGYEAVPAAVQRAINRQQGERAIRQLEAAAVFHPANPDLWIERANLELNRLGDPLAAAASYRRAWELPRGPYYAGRLHAEMLRRAGRPEEALAWLVRLHPQLPPGDEAAAADVVLGRIRELEKILGVSPQAVYRPPGR